MSNSNPNVIIHGQLDRLEGNLVRGRLGESARLYRLCIDGRWYFCTASRFSHSKLAGGVLRHARLPARVTAATGTTKGRAGVYWLYLHDTGEVLAPVSPFRQAGIVALMGLLTLVLGIALWLGWSWANQRPTATFVIALPVMLALAVAALLCGVFAAFGIANVVSLFRPHRLRAYRAYLSLRKELLHDDRVA